MPWKECKPMDERLRFIARLLEGDKMAPLCREFGISRDTDYKIYKRYKECGLGALWYSTVHNNALLAHAKSLMHYIFN